MAKKLNQICKELTLLQREGYFCVTLYGYDIPDMSQVDLQIIGEDDDIFQVHEAYPPPKEVHEDINCLLKNTGALFSPERIRVKR